MKTEGTLSRTIAIIMPGSDLSQRPAPPARRSIWPRMVSSTVSVMASREASDDRMPSCPIAMPSVTVMVVNSRGVPLACFTPIFTDCAWRLSAMLQGRGLVPAGGDTDEGLVDLLVAQAHRV